MKKKLEEKQIEILLQIIDEEVENTCNKLLSEDYDAGDAGGYTGGVDLSDTGAIGGVTRFWRDRGQLPGLLLSPVMDVASAFKKFGAKMGIAIGGLIGMTISSAIAALLPFNDPRTVKYIGQKFLAWEDKSMNFIDQQFKAETEKMRQGWETFKNDFWGIGFVASPFNAIAAALGASKGVDAALSVGNVITGGKLGGLIDKITADVEDPGDLDSYLAKGARGEEEKAEKRLKKDMYSARCLAQLDDPNWIDPECLGFADRSRFPAGPEGQQDFIDYVTGNANKIERIRNNQYKIEFGKQPSYNFYRNLDDQPIINLLKQNGLISENYIHEQKEPASDGGGINKLLDDALKGGQSSNAADAIARMEKKFGKEKTNEVLKQLGNALVKNPTAQAAAQAWTNNNLPKVAAETFGSLNQELISGQVPNVTLPQMKAYQAQAGDLAVKAVQQASKKVAIPPASLNIIKNVVQANTNKTFAPIKNIPDQPTAQPAPKPQAPVAAQPKQQATAAPAIVTTQPQTVPVTAPKR